MANIEQANHGFTVSEQSGKSVFTYQQEKYKAKNLLPLGCFMPLLALLLVALLKPDSVSSGVVWGLLIIGGGFWLIKYLMNLKRTEKSFSIDKDSFEVGDRKYLRKDITSMFVQQGNSQPLANVNMNHSTGSFIAFNANPAGLMAASAVNAAHSAGKIGEAAAQKFRENIARVNCKVFIRYGNKNVPLATGITMDTAEVMMDKIVDVSQQLQ